MEFFKMHGTGNDFIFIEDFENKYKGEESNMAKKLCHRRFGVGADGLVVVRNSEIAQAKMEIINSDGSWANMCGNAIRCFSKYCFEKNIVSTNVFDIETGDGVKTVEVFVDDNKIVTEVKVFMGEISFDGKLVPLNNKESLIDEEIIVDKKSYRATTLCVGVPHTVIIGEKNQYDVEEGSKIEKFNLFLEGTNVNFVEIVDRDNIKVKTWERGAGATYSCGTGCSAAAVVCNKLGHSNNLVNVYVPGGKLKIKIEGNKIYMIGPAEYICRGNSYQ